MVLLDTNILSELMKAEIDKNVEDWFSTINLQDTRISDISLAELYRGYARLDEGKKKTTILANLTRIELSYKNQTIPFDTACAKRNGATSARNERQGLSLDAFDGMLLAVAEQHSLDIVTRNKKHFEGRTTRKIINPFEAQP